jgi:hypothetical protein
MGERRPGSDSNKCAPLYRLRNAGYHPTVSPYLYALVVRLGLQERGCLYDHLGIVGALKILDRAYVFAGHQVASIVWHQPYLIRQNYRNNSRTDSSTNVRFRTIHDALRGRASVRSRTESGTALAIESD